ncbi:MAG: YdcH family protein [Hyphomicrobiales bacterium]
MMSQTKNPAKTLELLEKLRVRHQELDAEIREMEAEVKGGLNQLHLRRLKKEKLALKDEIIVLENSLLPDIIA